MLAKGVLAQGVLFLLAVYMFVAILVTDVKITLQTPQVKYCAGEQRYIVILHPLSTPWVRVRVSWAMLLSCYRCHVVHSWFLKNCEKKRYTYV